MLHTKTQHHLMENLTTTQSDEPISISVPCILFSLYNLESMTNIRIVQFANLAVLERGDSVPLRLLVKRRTGDRSRSITSS